MFVQCGFPKQQIFWLFCLFDVVCAFFICEIWQKFEVQARYISELLHHHFEKSAADWAVVLLHAVECSRAQCEAFSLFDADDAELATVKQALPHLFQVNIPSIFYLYEILSMVVNCVLTAKKL
jgi:hypothetical protein